MITCLFCNGNHNLERCFKFRDKSFEERTKFVMDKRLCVNCLRMTHFEEDTHSVKVTTLATQGLNGTSTTPSSQKALGSKQHANQRELVITCLFCNGNHNLERCSKFRDKSFEECTKFVMDKRLCVNCLRMNHFVRRCRQFRACLFSGCGKRHHSLLHPPDDRVIEEITQPVGRTSVDTPEAISAAS